MKNPVPACLKQLNQNKAYCLPFFPVFKTLTSSKQQKISQVTLGNGSSLQGSVTLGLKQSLKEQRTLRVSYQALKSMCWTKPPECFLWTINSPRAAGFVCWLLITEPSSLSFQARLPVQLRNQELLLPEPGFSAPGLNKLKSVFYQSKETFQEFQPASQMRRVGSMIWAAPVVNTESECCTGEGKLWVMWKRKKYYFFFCFFFFL